MVVEIGESELGIVAVVVAAAGDARDDVDACGTEPERGHDEGVDEVGEPGEADCADELVEGAAGVERRGEPVLVEMVGECNERVGTEDGWDGGETSGAVGGKTCGTCDE